MRLFLFDTTYSSPRISDTFSTISSSFEENSMDVPDKHPSPIRTPRTYGSITWLLSENSTGALNGTNHLLLPDESTIPESSISLTVTDLSL